MLYVKLKTHILQSHGTARDCNSILPVAYKFNSLWYTPLRMPPLLISPVTIQPMKKLTWHSWDLDGFINDGIYAPEDLDRLHQHINFPIERPALLENVARRLSDMPTPADSAKLRNLLDRNAVEELAESAMSKAWGNLTKFGTISAGILMILLIVQFAKGVLDTCIHGYALYRIYEWSVHLFAAMWLGLAHMFLYLAKPKSNNDPENLSAPKHEEPSPFKRQANQYRTSPPAVLFAEDEKKPSKRLREFRRKLRAASDKAKTSN